MSDGGGVPPDRRAPPILGTPQLPRPVVLILSLKFYSKDPVGVEDAINVFIFPDLSPSVGSEAALLAHEWGAIPGGGTITSFSDTRILM